MTASELPEPPLLVRERPQTAGDYRNSAVGDAMPLFEARLANDPVNAAELAAPVRQRFLLNLPLEDADASATAVVRTWEPGLKK